jgi:hypothetical protein
MSDAVCFSVAAAALTTVQMPLDASALESADLRFWAAPDDAKVLRLNTPCLRLVIGIKMIGLEFQLAPEIAVLGTSGSRRKTGDDAMYLSQGSFTGFDIFSW